MTEEAGVEGAAARARQSRPDSVRRTRKLSRAKLVSRTIGRFVAANLGSLLVALLSRTWRPKWEGLDNLVAARGEGGGHFITLWHGRMLVAMAHHRKRGWKVLVSKSGDGDMITAILERFGYGVIRGSASRGGARALREMLGALREGSVLIITPDGPRGPMHSIQPGLVWMARATGYQVVPGGFVADRAWHMKSWDRFTIPKPFARVAFVFGAPIAVPREATTEDLERSSRLVVESMQACEQRAFSMLGMTGET